MRFAAIRVPCFFIAHLQIFALAMATASAVELGYGQSDHSHDILSYNNDGHDILNYREYGYKAEHSHRLHKRSPLPNIKLTKKAKLFKVPKIKLLKKPKVFTLPKVKLLKKPKVFKPAKLKLLKKAKVFTLPKIKPEFFKVPKIKLLTQVPDIGDFKPYKVLKKAKLVPVVGVGGVILGWQLLPGITIAG